MHESGEYIELEKRYGTPGTRCSAIEVKSEYPPSRVILLFKPMNYPRLLRFQFSQ